MEQAIKDILDTIDKSIGEFQDAIPGIQKLLYDELQPLIKELKIQNGKLLNNVENLKLIGSIQNKLQRIIVSPEYKKYVQNFIDSFTAVSNLNNIYFSQFNQKYKPNKTLAIIKELSIERTINDLVGQGLSSNVIAPVQKILQQNITSGGSYADFQEVVRNHLLTNETGDGSLQRYTKQITTDAINQYNAQYGETVAQDLQFNWGRYLGTTITTSREFCILLRKKQWVHKSELTEIIKGHIDGHECKLSNTTKLPLGMIPGTNPDNFKILRGGYNCGDQFFWVPDNAVPEAVKRNLQNKISPPPEKTEKINSEKKFDLEKVDKIENIIDVEKLFLKNVDVIKELFHNTTFKSLKTTRSAGLNGATDMNGNIALSIAKTNQLIDALNGIKLKDELTLDQEMSVATLWHEIWHNTNKANTTNISASETRYMELGNEFVSRKTIDNFFEMLGGKLRDQSLKVNRSDTGYNIWVKNYDKLISHFQADENIVIEYMKDKMKNGNYSEVKNYLIEAIEKGIQFSKVKTSEIRSGVQDAINYSEDAFNKKYG